MNFTMKRNMARDPAQTSEAIEQCVSEGPNLLWAREGPLEKNPSALYCSGTHIIEDDDDDILIKTTNKQ